MPRDLQDIETETRTSIRVAVLELAARVGNDDELRAALRRVISDRRSHAEDLWDAYRSRRPDARARLFARFAD